MDIIEILQKQLVVAGQDDDRELVTALTNAIDSIKELPELKKKARLMEQYQFDSRMESDRNEKLETELQAIKERVGEKNIANIITKSTLWNLGSDSHQALSELTISISKHILGEK